MAKENLVELLYYVNGLGSKEKVMYIQDITGKMSGLKGNEKMFFVGETFYSVYPVKGNVYKIYSALHGGDTQFGVDHRDALEKHLTVYGKFKEVA